MTVNSTFTPSANVLTAANRARGMLYIIKRSFLMSDEWDLRTSIQYFGATTSRMCPPSKLSEPQKGINHLEIMQSAAARWVKGLEVYLWRTSKSPKTTTIRKKKAKKWFGFDSQNIAQPNRSASNSIAQVLQKARAKMIINETVSSNRENLQKTKQFGRQGC